MNVDLPVISGTIATVLFALSTLPMVVKAYRTKDLKSYSLGYLVLGNVGNLFYSMYVYNLPSGPIWLLHSFYLIVTGLMLFWYLRYESWPKIRQQMRRNKMQAQQRAQSSPKSMPVYNATERHAGYGRIGLSESPPLAVIHVKNGGPHGNSQITGRH